MNPDERARLLENTDLFADAHATASSDGQSAIPTDLDVNEHYVAFVQLPESGSSPGSGKSRLIELDGRKSAPLDHGECVDLLEVRI